MLLREEDRKRWYRTQAIGKIFADILGYEVQELRRGSEEFIGYGQNPNFRVFALNLPKNQLTQLTEEAMDELFCKLREEFHIKPEDCPIFYLYDRDVLSYQRNELRKKYVKNIQILMVLNPEIKDSCY